MIVAAFGDPGLAGIRETVPVAAVGLAEAAMLEAAVDGRRFGIATTTPALAAQIGARVDDLHLRQQYTGARFTVGDPNALVADPIQLRNALAQAVEACTTIDGAEVVIIGGGPLGRAAIELQPLFSAPIVAPIPASVHRLIDLI